MPHLYSQHHVLVHPLIKQYDIPEENVKILGMPPRDMINSLRKGEIDGFMVGEPEGNKSVNLGVGCMAAISPQIWKDHMDHVFLAPDTFISEQPEKLQELVNQLVRGGEFIKIPPKRPPLWEKTIRAQRPTSLKKYSPPHLTGSATPIWLPIKMI